MKATRSRVPFRISAGRAGTGAKPSFSRAEPIASITSSRELKIAARGGDIRGATAVLISPLHADHAQKEQATRGAYAARVEQGEELTRAAASTGEPPMHQRGAASLHLATCRRDAEAGAPLIVPFRRRADRCTAAKRWTSERLAVKNKKYVLCFLYKLSVSARFLFGCVGKYFPT